jgi:hypothetical protein
MSSTDDSARAVNAGATSVAMLILNVNQHLFILALFLSVSVRSESIDSQCTALLGLHGVTLPPLITYQPDNAWLSSTALYTASQSLHVIVFSQSSWKRSMFR